jgi:heme-degrading monooxygenase HmoA
MYIATFFWKPGTYDEEFNELNTIIQAAAKKSPGYIGVEEWVSDTGKQRSATYYWETIDGINALACDPSHLVAKQKYAKWYDGYHVVISEVIKSYCDAAFPQFTPNVKWVN